MQEFEKTSRVVRNRVNSLCETAQQKEAESQALLDQKQEVVMTILQYAFKAESQVLTLIRWSVTGNSSYPCGEDVLSLGRSYRLDRCHRYSHSLQLLYTSGSENGSTTMFLTAMIDKFNIKGEMKLQLEREVCDKQQRLEELKREAANLAEDVQALKGNTHEHRYNLKNSLLNGLGLTILGSVLDGAMSTDCKRLC